MSKERTEEKCCHHWLIGRPVGSVSKGVCKLCGAEKEFRNNLWDCFKRGG